MSITCANLIDNCLIAGRLKILGNDLRKCSNNFNRPILGLYIVLKRPSKYFLFDTRLTNLCATRCMGLTYRCTLSFVTCTRSFVSIPTLFITGFLLSLVYEELNIAINSLKNELSTFHQRQTCHPIFPQQPFFYSLHRLQFCTIKSLIPFHIWYTSPIETKCLVSVLNFSRSLRIIILVYSI